jgi:hypothetical protein
MTMKTIMMATLVGCATAGLAHTAMAAGETKLSGRIYTNLSNISEKTDGVKTDNSGAGIDVKRFYLTADHAFDDMWSVDITTDFNYIGNDSQTQVYIKKAYLQARFSDAAVLRVGSADLPWVPFIENLYGYRYLENVLVDREKYGTSADYGVHLGGKLAGGMVDYAASVISGAGYKKLQRSNSVDFSGRLSVNPIKDLTLGVGAYNGKLGQDVVSDPAENTAKRYDAVVAYVSDRFRVGGEYFTAKNWSQVQSPLTDKAEGYSIWGSVNATREVAVFARYDSTDRSKRLNPTLTVEYYNAGVSYTPVKGVDLALAYKHQDTSDDITATKRNEIGIWAQGRF